MNSSVKNLPKSEVELTIEVSPDEIRTDLASAANRLAQSSKISGFRPGHVPYDLVKARFGEMKIWEEALQPIIRRTYAAALKENRVKTVGQPYFSVETLAPGNPLVYKVKTAVLPAILKLADYRSLKVKTKEIKVGDEEVANAIKQVSRMQTREIPVDRPATSADKVVVDMNMFRDNVPIDGGVALGHGIYLNEEYYVPGLNEKLVGIRKGETREFTLSFPKEHYLKNIAGRDVQFKVIAKDILELAPPALDDDFAKSLGAETVSQLRELIRKNLEAEALTKEVQREEIEILELIVGGSSFGDIPDALINTETERMARELEASVSSQGLQWPKYLAGIKKTEAELKLDFSPRALRRIKTALVIREIADREKIEADDSEVSREIEEAMNKYSGDTKAQSLIRSEEYAEEARAVSRNRKTVEFLRNLISR